MNILYISASDVPSDSANSIHVVKMCNAFSALGHDVVLTACTGSKSATEVRSSLPEVYGVAGDFSVYPVNVQKIPGFSYIHGFMAAIKIRKINPDLVFTRSLHAAVLAAIFGWPVIFEAHSPMRDTGRINDWLLRLLVKCNNFIGLVVITQALKEHYAAYKELNGKNVFVAPDGADVALIDDEPPVPVSSNRLQVGYVGHLYPGKGMEIIAPLSRLAEWAEFTVVGGVNPDLQHWKDECSGVSNIRFIGQIPHSEVPGILKRFDVVLLPNQLSVRSQGKVNIGQWTSPLKAFEYMAAGKAILASDIPVLHEVLEDDVNAIFCDSTDVRSWYEALIRLAGNPQTIEELGKNARVVFEEKYTWKSRASNILEYFSTFNR